MHGAGGAWVGDVRAAGRAELAAEAARRPRPRSVSELIRARHATGAQRGAQLASALRIEKAPKFIGYLACACRGARGWRDARAFGARPRRAAPHRWHAATCAAPRSAASLPRASRRRRSVAGALAMAGRTPRRKPAAHRCGTGREVDDDELFGHAYACPPRSRQPRADRSARRHSMPALPPRRAPRAESPPRSASPRKSAERQTGGEARGAAAERSVDERRQGVALPPRRYADVVASFGGGRDAGMLHGAPRLSAVAANAARMYAGGGHLLNLSALADEFVLDILWGDAVTPEVLARLEQLNPSRVNVLEALWARLCVCKYEERELPAGVNWWRALYELRVRQDSGRLERATKRLRLGYSKAHEERERRRLEKTTRVVRVERRGRRASAPSSSMGLVGRMRLELRRQRARR